MFVATLVNVKVAVRVGVGENLAVGVGVCDLVNVGVAVRVNALVSVALGVRDGSSVGEFLTAGDETTDTRVWVGIGSLLLHPANINAPNSTNRKITRRMNFLLGDYEKQLQQINREPWFQRSVCVDFVLKIAERAQEKISL